MNHREASEENRRAWEAGAYEAWCERYGTPELAAARIRANPEHCLRRILPFLGDPRGRTIANPLGSHGRVGVALASMGADTMIFDISHSNARYARELAAAADVSVDFIVGDFLDSARTHAERHDAAVMELGVVHYFVDLERFVSALRTVLRSAGVMVLTDFHPMMRKTVSGDGRSEESSGDYFSADVEDAATPYEVFLAHEVPRCRIRRWTLGELVSAFACSGFRIDRLIEHPDPVRAHLPGTFTLTAIAD